MLLRDPLFRPPVTEDPPLLLVFASHSEGDDCSSPHVTRIEDFFRNLLVS